MSPFGDVAIETNASNAFVAGYLLGNGKLLAHARGTTISYYLADGLGSTRLLTNPAGAITDTYTYAAFGEPLTSSGTTVNAYRYAGQQYDALTSLYSMRARYYSPTVGRFMTRDTWAYDFHNPIELNRYVYTANNPSTLTDPTGHAAFTEFMARFNESVKRTLSTANLGTSATLIYAKLVLSIYKAIPLLTGAACIFVPIMTQSDIGPTCQNVSLDEITGLFSKGVRAVFQAVPEGSNPLVASARLIRQLAKIPLTAGGPNKNLSIAAVSINNQVQRWFWAVSGRGGPITTAVEDIMRKVAVSGSQDEVVTDLANSILRVASDHAETKILERLLKMLQNNEIPANSRISITLYTELQPCPGCGGEYGLGGNIQTLFDMFTNAGHQLDINIVWSYQYKK
ncbi:MAG: RHS repeat-associated core domain-containing protein [Taibaiella sp.]|nr:RHS repeat-associated core domain-containing protein [Taibaiella sp.]